MALKKSRYSLLSVYVFLIELLVSVSRTSDLSSEEKQKHQLSLEQSLI